MIKTFIPLQSFLQCHFLHLFLHLFLHYCHQRNCLLLSEIKILGKLIYLPNPLCLLIFRCFIQSTKKITYSPPYILNPNTILCLSEQKCLKNITLISMDTKITQANDLQVFCQLGFCGSLLDSYVVTRPRRQEEENGP